jgi:hypothetical protein
MEDTLLSPNAPITGNSEAPTAEPETNTPEAPAAGQKPQPENSNNSADKSVGAPEKYEFKFPDGITPHPEATPEFEKVARELNLSQDQAQKLVDIAAKHFAPEKFAKAQEAQWNALREKWTAEVKNDPEFGGRNFEETRLRTRNFIVKFAGNDLRELDAVFDSGWGDNPALFRFLARVAKATGEDKLVEGSPSANDTRSVAAKLYPTMTQNR